MVFFRRAAGGSPRWTGVYKTKLERLGSAGLADFTPGWRPETVGVLVLTVVMHADGQRV